VGAIAREIKIFVSSPSDVRDERRRLQRVVERLDGQLGAVRFALVRWEEKFYRADATFRKQIDRAVDCNIVMSVFWTRLGTELPPEFDERLAKADPGNAGWQRGLSVACNKVGNVRVAQGHLADALEAYRDCLAISERLAKDNADNVRSQLDLVLSHWMLAKLGDNPVGHRGLSLLDCAN
jgi:hypothetical protein